MSQAKQKALASEIRHHRSLYYNDESVISDEAFDALIDELRALNPEHPVLAEVGAPPASEWKKYEHHIPMGSLDKAQTPEELKEWILKSFKPHNSVFIVEKLDGISIELVYEKGRLIAAATRGSGVEGENILQNVLRMKGVKKQLPISFTGSIRGEIILTHENHKAFFADSPNPRNAAGGTAKRLDGTGCERLNVLVYQAIGDVNLPTEVAQFEFLHYDLDLQVPNTAHFSSPTIEGLITETVKHWEDYHDKRKTIPYDIDGLVVRINELPDQIALGEHHMRPKGAIAFKFIAEEATTPVRDIILQCGNLGRITPVVEVDPVILAGAEVRRASLYNFAFINTIGIDIGAEVIIVRSNEVIPVVKSVVKSTGTTFQAPKACPSCSGPLEKQGEYLTCVSPDTCPAQIQGRIENWVSSLNILEWGGALIERLIISGKVKTVADLYALSIADLAELDRMGEKSATNCYNSLWAHNPLTLEEFFGSLAIPLIAKSSITMAINSGINSFAKIMDASIDELQNVNGFGIEKAHSLYEGLRRNRQLIHRLLENGVKVKEKNMNGKLTGKSFCITGKTNIKRADLKKLIEENGGEFKGSVGKSLQYLIMAAEDSNSLKAQGARKNGTETISEEQFLAMIQ